MEITVKLDMDTVEQSYVFISYKELEKCSVNELFQSLYRLRQKPNKEHRIPYFFWEKHKNQNSSIFKDFIALEKKESHKKEINEAMMLNKKRDVDLLLDNKSYNSILISRCIIHEICCLLNFFIVLCNVFIEKNKNDGDNQVLIIKQIGNFDFGYS